MDALQRIYESGVVGAGGAGFPTHIKYNTKAQYLLINAAECEPLLFTDQYEMEHYPDEIVQGIMIGKEILNAKEVIIGIKSKHKKSIEALTSAIEKVEAPIKIHEMESFYPAGDEQGLIFEILNIPLNPGSIPISEGIVVTNVTTAKNIYFSTIGKGVIRKTVTVTGEVKNPIVLDVSVGTSIGRCIDEAGGSSLEEYAIILGGPMMGKMAFSSDINSTFVTKTSGGIIVLPMDHPLITRRRQSIEHIKNQTASACIQCDFCTELCPRYLIGHPLHPHEVMKAFGNDGQLQGEKLLQASLCCECGICELYSCPMGLSPRIVNATVKKMLREANAPKISFDSQGVHPMEAYRRLPTDVLVKKISIDKYYKYHNLPNKKIDSQKVVIPMSQHIGKPAEPIVKVGDEVHANDMIGKVSMEDMGACVHASIDGIIESVTNKEVVIKAGDRV
ncbi:MAG: SLBB domain-containing protein [Tissierellia bacterium]|nr:SLBB domain-containing protein [Tissierellia bacterium]